MSIIGSGVQASPLSKPKHILFDTPEYYVSRLEEGLGTAEGEPLGFAELIGRLGTIWADDDRQLVLERLEQMSLPTGPQRQVAQALQLVRKQTRINLQIDQAEH